MSISKLIITLNGNDNDNITSSAYGLRSRFTNTNSFAPVNHIVREDKMIIFFAYEKLMSQRG